LLEVRSDKAHIPWWRFLLAGVRTLWELARMGPRRALRRLRIRWLRYRYGRIQLSTEEVESIVGAIARWPGCRLLVFGTGYDTPLWLVLNRGGRTAFIEDDPQWIETARRRCPDAEAHRVTYPTVLSEWPTLLQNPERTFVELPAAVTAEPWDVILVDAPSGNLKSFWAAHGCEPPGRSCSIAAARRLIRPGGDVFVHDCERPAEDVFTRHYFGDGALVQELRGRVLLRHYRV
jgi:glucuronoxylan 4-O-methyltransferase